MPLLTCRAPFLLLLSLFRIFHPINFHYPVISPLSSIVRHIAPVFSSPYSYYFPSKLNLISPTCWYPPSGGGGDYSIYTVHRSANIFFRMSHHRRSCACQMLIIFCTSQHLFCILPVFLKHLAQIVRWLSGEMQRRWRNNIIVFVRFLAWFPCLWSARRERGGCWAIH